MLDRMPADDCVQRRENESLSNAIRAVNFTNIELKPPCSFVGGVQLGRVVSRFI